CTFGFDWAAAPRRRNASDFISLLVPLRHGSGSSFSRTDLSGCSVNDLELDRFVFSSSSSVSSINLASVTPVAKLCLT
ncbi:hypothetical protein ALC60_08647, partial [Trachymyrmex zeteki]